MGTDINEITTVGVYVGRDTAGNDAHIGDAVTHQGEVWAILKAKGDDVLTLEGEHGVADVFASEITLTMPDFG